jgi:hypothetical protein
MMATAVVYALPPVILFFAPRRWVIGAMTPSALLGIPSSNRCHAEFVPSREKSIAALFRLKPRIAIDRHGSTEQFFCRRHARKLDTEGSQPSKNAGSNQMSFVLSFERTHRVVRATAAGVIASQDLHDLDMALVTFLARAETVDGPTIRAVFDFSQVAALAVPETMTAQRASRPAVVRGQRVMVRSRMGTCSIVDTLLHSQRMAGGNQMAVVESLDAAHAFLGMAAPHYEDI